MDKLDQPNALIGFSTAHKERLNPENGSFSLLRSQLLDSGYRIETSHKHLSSSWLGDVDVLVVGTPIEDFDPDESIAVESFLRQGGGLLLCIDEETMLELFFAAEPNLGDMILELMGIRCQEYHNKPPTRLLMFRPHYITAGVTKVKVGKIAALDLEQQDMVALARTRATDQVIIAGGSLDEGRIVIVGDSAWLSNEYLPKLDNATLAANVFRWLARDNAIDIGQVVVPSTVDWGQSAVVSLSLQNEQANTRPRLECVLESDVDALISEPVRKQRSVPPGAQTQMRWTVKPQILGDQRLRLSIYTDSEALFYDALPNMTCLAPGYLTLETKNNSGAHQTDFRTGDYIKVEGAFHWSAKSPPIHHLDLDIDEGLLKRSYEQGHGIDRWHLQAVAPGKHGLSLRVAETGQHLLAMIHVKPSDPDRLKEVQAAYVYPLDAEIAERLRQVDPQLSTDEVRHQPFRLLSPKEFVQKAYAERDVPWLLGILAAARREQYQNFDLLDLLLTHIAPTYVPSRPLGETFIPFDPELASELARLHPTDRRYLEYNFLQDEESDPLTVKQNVAAYLLHEKYGHGFFFTQTRLGQQLTLLMHYGVRRRPDHYGEEQAQMARLIEDSAIIVNEGFAAWLELTFLEKLGAEIRQAAYPRYVLLIDQATGLYARQHRSEFFRTFPPHFDSRYREGFEYLDFIAKRLDVQCVVRAFLIATNIDFGIRESSRGELSFTKSASEMHEMLFDTKPDWRSRARLEAVAELLRDNLEVISDLVRKRHCPFDCRQDGCPIEAFVEEQLGWRLS